MMKGILIGLLVGIISHATYGQTTEQNIKPDTQVTWESLSENNGVLNVSYALAIS
jgi:DNA-binding transcriptional regulator YdaS (Cro superfamily)